MVHPYQGLLLRGGIHMIFFPHPLSFKQATTKRNSVWKTALEIVKRTFPFRKGRTLALNEPIGYIATSTQTAKVHLAWI